MRPLLRVFILLTTLLHATVGANPAEADRVRQSFKADMEKWSKAFASATTDEARKEALAKKPDSATYARTMWQLIGTALDQEWALDSMAWYVTVTASLHTEVQVGARNPILSKPGDTTHSNVRAFAKELQAIADAVPAYHMKTEKLAPLCLAFAGTNDPASLKLLEKIEATHARKTVQGVAALAIAIRLRALGDEPELMSRRLTLLKKAIIESADMKIQGAPVTQLIQEELYVVTNLTKGRPAPQLAGADSAGRPMQLAGFRGKIVVLLFWNSSVPGVVPLLESLTKFSRDSDGKVTLVGVNSDTLENLRIFQRKDADLLDFANFSDPGGELAKVFRVAALPLAYVIDPKGVIAYSGPPGAFMQASVQGLLNEKPAPPAKAPPALPAPRKSGPQGGI